ncbi:hypothetical protein O0L34_g15691 [Tuta absoluta]|nr:hypothetical protein O0L34_g15691 [Tuta absoluta]
MDSDDPHKAIAKGLNSPELKRNPNIPYVDDAVELNHVRKHEYPDVKIDNNDSDSPDDTQDEKENQPLVRSKIHATDLGSPRQSPNSDTIVVNTPEGTLYITLDPDTTRSSMNSPTSPRTVSTATPGSSKDESDHLIDEEQRNEIEQRREGLRRNSISLPTLQNLEKEVMKQQYLNDDVSMFYIRNF